MQDVIAVDIQTPGIVGRANQFLREESRAADQPAAGRLRILTVTNMFPCEEKPAFGIFVAEQVNWLRTRGHEVDVFIIRGAENRFAYICAARDISRIFAALHYDVVHAHYGLSGVPAVIGARPPLVVTYHGSDLLVGRVQPRISRAVARFASANIVVSARMPKLPRSAVIPCGVDLARMIPQDRDNCRVRLGLPRGKRLVLFPYDPGRAIKRVDVAKGAVALLNARGVAADLLVVHGEQPNAMPDYYGAADVVVLCSESEGSPMSVKEALACERFVVTVDVGDAAEIVAPAAGCEVVERDPAGLADGIEKVFARRFEATSHLRDAAMRYELSSTMLAVERVYHSVCASRVGETRSMSRADGGSITRRDSS